MAGYSGTWTSPICVENPVNTQQEWERNKFVFVNRNKEHIIKPSTVLINPHFKDNKKVYLNPNFQISNYDNSVRPKVHINPNVLKSVTSASQPVANAENYAIRNPSVTSFDRLKCGYIMPDYRSNVASVESRINQVQKTYNPVVETNCFQQPRPNAFCKINSVIDNRKKVFTNSKIVNFPKKTLEKSVLKPIVQQKLAVSTDDNEKLRSNQRMVHTRLKIVNNPKSKQVEKIDPLRKQKSDVPMRDKAICTRFKYIRKEETPKTSLDANNSGSLRTRTINLPKRDLLENSSVRKNSIITRYKYIRNGAKLVKINKDPLKSKYKIVNNNVNKSQQADKATSSTNRKKYVYLNKYNSSSFLANNVIFKNSKQRNLIKINGILYQNSPCLLKRASLSSKTNQVSPRVKGKSPVKALVKCQGKYKIVRSQIASASKLKKSNIACSIYKKTGKCNGQKTGTCIKVHNPDQIVLCKRFLQGVCLNNNCLLSHKVSSEKMPTCKYFLEGLCNKTECQYLHVKISPNADICKDFLEGFCKEGIKCDKRHQFLCPEYEKYQKCSKTKCRYPHGTSEVVKTGKKKFKKIISKEFLKKTIDNTVQGTSSDNCQIRYYKENTDKAGENGTSLKRTNTEEEVVLLKRRKLGSLPSFIPIL